jgi:hypothetical protein
MLIGLERVGAWSIVVKEVLQPHSPAALLIIILDNKGEQAATCLCFGLVLLMSYFVKLLAVLRRFFVMHTV